MSRLPFSAKRTLWLMMTIALIMIFLLTLVLSKTTAVTALFQDQPEPNSEPVSSIDAFTFTAEDVADTGKQITFQWQTTNATQARIISGASQYNARWWDVPANGELEITLPRTLFHDPEMILMVTDGAGQYASQAVTIPWECEFPTFFSPPPKSCALHEHSVSNAAEQQFEHGRLIWIERVSLRDEFREDRIFAFYESGPAPNNWKRFDNVEPTDAITPEGCGAPIQLGFSRVWQENEDVRLKLGCPLNGEQYFSLNWQWQLSEAGSTVVYLSTIDNRVIQLYGERWGGWHYQRP